MHFKRLYTQSYSYFDKKALWGFCGDQLCIVVHGHANIAGAMGTFLQ